MQTTAENFVAGLIDAEGNIIERGSPDDEDCSKNSDSDSDGSSKSDKSSCDDAKTNSETEFSDSSSEDCSDTSATDMVENENGGGGRKLI